MAKTNAASTIPGASSFNRSFGMPTQLLDLRIPGLSMDYGEALARTTDLCNWDTDSWHFLGQITVMEVFLNTATQKGGIATSP